jgi:hypothetical protein
MQIRSHRAHDHARNPRVVEDILLHHDVRVRDRAAVIVGIDPEHIAAVDRLVHGLTV